MKESYKYKYSGIHCDENYDLFVYLEQKEKIEAKALDVNLKEIIQSVLEEMLDELNIKYEKEEINDVSNKMLKIYHKNPDMPFKFPQIELFMLWINRELEFNLKENTAVSSFEDNNLEDGSILYVTMQLDVKKILKFAILNQRVRLLSVYATIAKRTFEMELQEAKYKYKPNSFIIDDDGDFVITDTIQNVEIIKK